MISRRCLRHGAAIALAALVVLPFGLAALRGRWSLLRRNAGLVTLYGVLAVAGAQFCYFAAVVHMQVGPAILIEYTAPAAVVIWMWLRHGQRPGPVTLVGAVLAAAGLVLVLDLVSGAQLSVPGVLWALGAMVGAGIGLDFPEKQPQHIWPSVRIGLSGSISDSRRQHRRQGAKLLDQRAEHRHAGRGREFPFRPFAVDRHPLRQTRDRRTGDRKGSMGRLLEAGSNINRRGRDARHAQRLTAP